LSAGSVNNAGAVDVAGGRIFSGVINNAQGALWRVTNPTTRWYFAGNVGFFNSGTLSFVNGADLDRWDGTVTQKRLNNGGELLVTNPLGNGDATVISGVTLVGQAAGRVRVQDQAVLALSCATSGTIVGEHAAGGVATINGLTVAEPTTLSTTALSASPWRWTGGDVNATAATLTNAGLIEHAGGRIFTGTLVNQPGATWKSTGPGTLLYFAGASSISNQGALIMENGADTALWDGTLQQKRLTNSGTLRATNPLDNGEASTLSGFTLVGTGAGRVRVEDNAALNLALFTEGTLVGDHANTGVANIGGIVTSGPTTLALAPSSEPWRWTSGDVNATAFPLANAGRIVHAGGRIFSGTLNNQQGAQWRSIGPGTLLYFAGTTTVNNDATAVFALDGGADTALWDGNLQQKRLINAGTLQVTNAAENGDASSLTGITLVGQPQGRVNVQAGATLNMGVRISGSITGDHAPTGVANIGGIVLEDDTTFSNTTGSAPWRWTAGDIDATAAILTNQGLIEHTSGRIFAGTLLNSAGAGFRSVGSGALLYFADTVAVTNSGVLSFGNGADTALWSGSVGQKVLSNSGLLLVDNPAANGETTNLNGFVLSMPSAQSTIRIESNARLTVNAVASGAWSHTRGRIEGTGQLVQSGTFTVGGTPGSNPPATLQRGVIAPGIGAGADTSAIGELRIATGRLVMTGESELELTLRNTGGTTPVQTVDSLRIDDSGTPGEASVLGGVLRIRRFPGSTDVIGGQEYQIVRVVGNGGTLTGEFGSIVDANPQVGVRYSVRYAPQSAFLKVIKRCNLSDVASPGQVPLFDGEATPDDIVVFVDWFFAGDLRADYASQGQVPQPDGQLTADDIIVFIDLFFQGCGF
jgi:hypothetical protein